MFLAPSFCLKYALSPFPSISIKPNFLPTGLWPKSQSSCPHHLFLMLHCSGCDPETLTLDRQSQSSSFLHGESSYHPPFPLAFSNYCLYLISSLIAHHEPSHLMLYSLVWQFLTPACFGVNNPVSWIFFPLLPGKFPFMVRFQHSHLRMHCATLNKNKNSPVKDVQI